MTRFSKSVPLVAGTAAFPGNRITHDLRNRVDEGESEALQVGRDLALTPGAVVERDEVAELIQYAPVTDRVRERPVLVVPPPIGRFYFLDLRPGRSFIEYSVARGLSDQGPGVRYRGDD